MPRIVLADTVEAISQAAVLFHEYAAALTVDLAFQDFEQEVASLLGEYAPPTGRLFLSFVDGATDAAGCVALRRIDVDTCEMKRLYVRTGFRGHGVGRALALAVIAAAHEIGYRFMRLDTLPEMSNAQ